MANSVMAEPTVGPIPQTSKFANHDYSERAVSTVSNAQTMQQACLSTLEAGVPMETDDDRKLGDEKVKEGLVFLRKFYDNKVLIGTRPQSVTSYSSVDFGIGMPL